MTTPPIPVSPAHAEILAMPQEKLQQFAVRLWDALNASDEETRHMHQVFGGWTECKDCQAANEACDGSLCCEKSKQRQRTVREARRLP